MFSDCKMDYFEYLLSGVKMNCSISVDFTGSNGNINNPKSLHYFNRTSQKYN